eukprot:Em0003g1641a
MEHSSDCASDDLYCYVCKVAFPSNWRLKRHKETDKHQSYVEFYSVVESNAPPDGDMVVETGVNDEGRLEHCSQHYSGAQADDNCTGYDSETSSDDMDINAGVRLRNIFSNKQAPSRDIANYFANLQSIQYICQGGLFNNNDTCGTGLQILYNHPNVQHFLNGIPPKTLLADKAIYQPGAARKASHAGMQKFSLLQLVTVGVVSATVEELNMMDPPFTVIYHDPILPTAECHEHYAVVSQSRDLVCTGSYVQLCKPFQQFSYGELLATLSVRNGATVCIIRGFEAVEVEPGVPLLSEFDCPYYNLTRTIFSTDSSNISAAISMMHHCEEEEGGCHFVETDVCQLVERQETIQHKLTFQHDWTNTLYCTALEHPLLRSSTSIVYGIEVNCSLRLPYGRGNF